MDAKIYRIVNASLWNFTTVITLMYMTSSNLSYRLQNYSFLLFFVPDYHHNFFEGAVNRDMKFWEPELVRSYTKMI